jgi:Mrp family chromosome partitioning ATPase
MSRSASSSNYLWMSARALNASRRVAIMGIVGGLVFVGALIAFVLVPRQASKAAVAVAANIQEKPDSTAIAAIRARALAGIVASDSMLAVGRRVVAVAPVVPVDTFPPQLIAQRDSLSIVVGSLNRLIERADNAPLPSSYRALGMSPVMAGDQQVRVLLDSLGDIERERDAFGAVGGVDPVYVALTSRATALGRQIQAIAQAKRSTARGQLVLLRPAAPALVPQVRVDTMKYLAQRLAAQRAYSGAVASLAQMRATDEKIDRESSRARDLANVGAPPLAMLGAALVLALTLGFAVAFGLELYRPHVADAREAEQVTGARVLTVIRPDEVTVERSRRQADAEAPPLIDIVSEGYRRLYLHLAATEANVPIVTVTGDVAPIVGTVASNLAAAAAYEARSTLLVDVDSATSIVAGVLRVPSNPGFAGIVSGTSDWADSIISTTIGRDRPLDVLPSGTRQTGVSGVSSVDTEDTAERIKGDFTRMERRYDLIVIAAPTEYVLKKSTTVMPSPDVVLCARVGHTRLTDLKRSVDGFRELDLRVHGLVLWDEQLPQIDTHEEGRRPTKRREVAASALVGT